MNSLISTLETILISSRLCNYYLLLSSFLLLLGRHSDILYLWKDVVTDCTCEKSFFKIPLHYSPSFWVSLENILCSEIHASDPVFFVKEPGIYINIL
jgi:hypothetical protein